MKQHKPFFTHTFSRFTLKDKVVFTRQLAALVNSGLALVPSLEILAEDCPNSKLKKALREIYRDVYEERCLVIEAMKKHPDCFDAVFLNMVEAGWSSAIDETLNRLAKLYGDLEKLENLINSAVVRPIVFGLLAIALWLTIKQLFIPLACLILLLLAIWLYYKTPFGRLEIDRLLLKLPFWGELNKKVELVRFCRIFGTLMMSGVPEIASIEITRDTLKNQLIANAIDAVRTEIIGGSTIGMALAREEIFPVMLIITIYWVEFYTAPRILLPVADIYLEQIEHNVKPINRIMDWAIVFILGVLVGIAIPLIFLIFR